MMPRTPPPQEKGKTVVSASSVSEESKFMAELAAGVQATKDIESTPAQTATGTLQQPPEPSKDELNQLYINKLSKQRGQINRFYKEFGDAIKRGAYREHNVSTGNEKLTAAAHLAQHILQTRTEQRAEWPPEKQAKEDSYSKDVETDFNQFYTFIKDNIPKVDIPKQLPDLPQMEIKYFKSLARRAQEKGRPQDVKTLPKTTEEAKKDFAKAVEALDEARLRAQIIMDNDLINQTKKALAEKTDETTRLQTRLDDANILLNEADEVHSQEISELKKRYQQLIDDLERENILKEKAFAAKAEEFEKQEEELARLKEEHTFMLEKSRRAEDTMFDEDFGGPSTKLVSKFTSDKTPKQIQAPRSRYTESWEFPPEDFETKDNELNPDHDDFNLAKALDKGQDQGQRQAKYQTIEEESMLGIQDRIDNPENQEVPSESASQVGESNLNNRATASAAANNNNNATAADDATANDPATRLLAQFLQSNRSLLQDNQQLMKSQLKSADLKEECRVFSGTGNYAWWRAQLDDCLKDARAASWSQSRQFQFLQTRVKGPAATIVNNMMSVHKDPLTPALDKLEAEYGSGQEPIANLDKETDKFEKADYKDTNSGIRKYFSHTSKIVKMQQALTPRIDMYRERELFKLFESKMPKGVTTMWHLEKHHKRDKKSPKGHSVTLDQFLVLLEGIVDIMPKQDEEEKDKSKENKSGQSNKGGKGKGGKGGYKNKNSASDLHKKAYTTTEQEDDQSATCHNTTQATGARPKTSSGSCSVNSRSLR